MGSPVKRLSGGLENDGLESEILSTLLITSCSVSRNSSILSAKASSTDHVRGEKIATA